MCGAWEWNSHMHRGNARCYHLNAFVLQQHPSRVGSRTDVVRRSKADTSAYATTQPYIDERLCKFFTTAASPLQSCPLHSPPPMIIESSPPHTKRCTS